MDAEHQRANAQYSANLDQTLKELQAKVREHELELQRVSCIHPGNETSQLIHNSFALINMIFLSH